MYMDMYKGISISILVQVNHADMLAHYRAQQYEAHYLFFWHRVTGMSQEAFELNPSRLSYVTYLT